MDPEDFTPEESAALEAMQSDTTPEPATEAPEAPAEPDEAPKEPEAPEPAPEAPSEPEAKADKPPPGYVPHGAMHAERVARQQAEEQLRQLQEQIEAQKKPAEPAPMPDPVMEPEKFAAWAAQQQAGPAQEIAQIRQQLAEQHQRQQMQATVARAEAEFSAQHPDYNEAIQHLSAARRQELAFLGLDEGQIQQAMQADIQGIIQSAMHYGKSPAEAAYTIAKARGYRPAEARSEGPDPAARIAAQAAAQAATQSLPQSGGPASSGGPTAKELAEMSDDEFAKLSDDVIQKAMGG